MKTVLHPITTMTRNILIGTLFSLSFALFGQSPTILQDQLKSYKTIQTDSVNDINAKYAAALSKLLEAAQKAGDKAAEESIRVELAGSGHPVKADWILGTWSYPGTNGVDIENYTFTPDGKVTLKWKLASGNTSTPTEGIYIKVNQTMGYKVDVADHIHFFVQDTLGRVEVLSWASPKQYPDKRKARKSKATRVP